MTKTPEGFLICHNVPIARTGWYEYLKKEIGADGDPNEIVKVYRSPEEVFSKQAIASFEGKPVTDEHPPELLTPDSVMIFTKGTVQNVIQGTKEKDLLIADLIIYDSVLINEIESGKREVSSGYECAYKDNGNGTYNQGQICGNHVAVVNAGRAGDRVAIKDSKIKSVEGDKNNMNKKVQLPRKHSSVRDFLAAVGLKHFATDAEPEEIMDAVEEMTSENQSKDEEPEKKEEKENVAVDEESTNPEVKALTDKVDKLTDLVTKVLESKEQKKPEDAIDAMIEELETKKGEDGEIGDEENSATIPVEEMNDEDIPGGEVTNPSDRPKNPIPNADSAAMLRALKAMKPVIANISNPTEKKKACDSLIAEFKKVKKGTGKNGYANIITAQKSNATKNQKAIDAKQKAAEQIGENLKKKFNPHYKEVK